MTATTTKSALIDQFVADMLARWNTMPYEQRVQIICRLARKQRSWELRDLRTGLRTVPPDVNAPRKRQGEI